MFDALYKNISRKVQLTDEEFAYCTSLFIPKKIRKRQYILQQGDVCKYTTFVAKGCLRSYTVDDKGEEHIVQFAIEDWWISDLYSYYTGEPAMYNIDAIEDSELLLIDRASEEKLYAYSPKFDRLFRLLLQGNHISNQRRIAASLSESAEDRYKSLVNTSPDIVQRVPQRMIASYLGITPESLSRIRKQMTGR